MVKLENPTEDSLGEKAIPKLSLWKPMAGCIKNRFIPDVILFVSVMILFSYNS